MPRATATRAVLAVLAAIGALAMAPAAAQAVAGSATPQLPADLTVGQTDVLGSIVLENLDEPSASNNVCNVSSSFPCDGMTGITLLPSCGFAGEMGCGAADPGVFDVAPTATGAPDTECDGMTFDVTDIPGPFGALLFTPVPPPAMPVPEVTLPVSGATCRIDFTFDVVRIPVGSPDPDGGVPTVQYAEATQYSGTSSAFGQGTSTVVVHKAQPAIATTASADVVLGSGTLTDTATVSDRFSPTAGATVEFRLYGPGDTSCSTPIVTTTSPLSAAGTATSAPHTPAAAGTYRWVATYSGDDNNAAASGACNDPGESVTVTAPVVPRATPAITVAASPNIVIGGQVSATATVAGRVNPVPGATVLFRVYGPDDATCSGPPAFAAAAPLSAGGVATSPPFTPASLRVGTYRWVASYSGDAANLPVATACNAPGSTVTVAPLPARVLSAGFTSAPRVGEPAFLVVGAYDPTGPISGIQVQFGEPRGLSGISACRLPAGFGITTSPMRLEIPYTFTTPGRHRITIVVLTGGCTSEQRRTVRTIEVVVAAGQATRSAFAAAASAAEPAARAAQSGCKNRFLRPTSKAATRLKVATAILCLVNAERRTRRLKALKRSRFLALAATEHSKDMLKRRFFDHVGPGGPTFPARLRKIRYHGASAAENIAYGANFNAKLVVQAWMNSPPHKANILGPRSRYLGIGIAVGIPVTPGRPGSTYTQVFGSSLK